MSEVMAKDLREIIRDNPWHAGRDAELAAFDEMAEKAEAYDRIMSTRYAVYFAQSEEDAKTIDYALAKLGYKPTPAEALKAVPDGK